MTNEEIRDFAGELPAFHLGDSTPVIRANSLSVLLDLARADEREKLSIEIDDLKSEIERLNSALESRKFIGG